MSQKIKARKSFDQDSNLYKMWSTPVRYWDLKQRKWTFMSQPSFSEVINELSVYSDSVIHHLKKMGPDCHLSMHDVAYAFGQDQTAKQCAEEIIRKNKRE